MFTRILLVALVLGEIWLAIYIPGAAIMIGAGIVLVALVILGRIYPMFGWFLAIFTFGLMRR